MAAVSKARERPSRPSRRTRFARSGFATKEGRPAKLPPRSKSPPRGGKRLLDKIGLSGEKGYEDRGIFYTASGDQVKEVQKDLENAIIDSDVPHAILSAVEIYRVLINAIEDNDRKAYDAILAMYRSLPELALDYMTPHNYFLLFYTHWFYNHELITNYGDERFSLPWLLTVVQLLASATKDDYIAKSKPILIRDDDFREVEERLSNYDDTETKDYNKILDPEYDELVIKITNKIHDLLQSDDTKEREEVFDYIELFLGTEMNFCVHRSEQVGCKKNSKGRTRPDGVIWKILEEFLDCDLLQPMIDFYMEKIKRKEGVIQSHDLAFRLLMSAYSVAVHNDAEHLKSERLSQEAEVFYQGIDEQIKSWEDSPLLEKFLSGKYEYELYR